MKGHAETFDALRRMPLVVTFGSYVGMIHVCRTPAYLLLCVAYGWGLSLVLCAIPEARYTHFHHPARHQQVKVRSFALGIHIKSIQLSKVQVIPHFHRLVEAQRLA